MMTIRAVRGTKSLLLRFSDASDLWLSQIGARLVSAAALDSAAHRLVGALSKRLGWGLLAGRNGWPVPRPCKRGDWLAVKRDKRSALMRSILSDAEIVVLPEPEPEVWRAFTAFRDRLPDVHDVARPSPDDRRLRLVLLQIGSLAGGGDIKRKRADTLENECNRDPDLMLAWQHPDDGSFRFTLASTIAEKLRERFAQPTLAVPAQPASLEPTEAMVRDVPAPMTTYVPVTEDHGDVPDEVTADDFDSPDINL